MFAAANNRDLTFFRKIQLHQFIPVFLFAGIWFSQSGNQQPDIHTILRDSVALSSRIAITSATEPGEPMVISGTIYLPDGITPAQGAILAIWHTDANGEYTRGRGEADEEHPRLHGRMKTGSDGKYEFRTIKPAPYSNGTSPAHIHAVLSAPGFPEYGGIMYYFEGDRFIKQDDRSRLNHKPGGTPSILTLHRDSSGVLLAIRNLLLEHVGAEHKMKGLKW